jgi:hypothetical protein
MEVASLPDFGLVVRSLSSSPAQSINVLFPENTTHMRFDFADQQCLGCSIDFMHFEFDGRLFSVGHDTLRTDIYWFKDISYDVPEVPEPANFLLVGTGFVVVLPIALGRRKARRRRLTQLAADVQLRTRSASLSC